MEPRDASRAIFGTTEPEPKARVLKAGRLSCSLHGASIRAISWDGVEIIRAIDCPIRDENWGTYGQEGVEEDVVEEGDSTRATRRFSVADGAVSGERVLTLTSSGRLSVALTLTAHADFKTNRAGFTVLHPLAGVSGKPLTVLHSDGSRQDASFPLRVAAAQPVFDIAALAHAVDGVDVSIAFSGEIFEMEDQRNWGDASYKTYCRPLTKPYPYELAKGEIVRQEIVVEASGARAAADASLSTGQAALGAGEPQGRLPELLLAIEEDWLPTDAERIADLTPGGVLLRMGDGSALARIAELVVAAGVGIDLEIVVPEGADPAAHCAQIARECEGLAVVPRRAIALPEPYLKSHQPGGPWPAGAIPEQCVEAVRAAFPAAEIGAGMLTNFTEFNRYPPAPGIGDYVTHGSCAIVHAADDWSVTETLETLPQIFQSATTIAAGRAYRLGLVSIGMRSNPYGAGVAENPERIRKAMAMDDPRQQGLFAAAYAIGAFAAATGAGASAIALAAPAGPFGVMNEDGGRFPIFNALKALARLANRPAIPLSGLARGLAGVAARDDAGHVQAVIANCSLEPTTLLLPDAARIRLLDAEEVDAAAQDPDWLDTAPELAGGAVSLGPCALAFVTLEL
jgi:hypothetical protein